MYRCHLVFILSLLHRAFRFEMLFCVLREVVRFNLEKRAMWEERYDHANMIPSQVETEYESCFCGPQE